jgi:hypothetical protein
MSEGVGYEYEKNYVNDHGMVADYPDYQFSGSLCGA